MIEKEPEGDKMIEYLFTTFNSYLLDQTRHKLEQKIVS
jgi:hypothetical protein